MIDALKRYGMEPVVVDPVIDIEGAFQHYDLTVTSAIPLSASFDAVIVAVSHNQFLNIPLERWRALLGDKGVLMDLKGILPRSLGAFRL
jgi:UDP-N-acetyl-D-galactosamine dehydrogenase